MSDILLITQPMAREELKKIAEQRYGDMVKAVVDVARKLMAIGGELHADEEMYLLENGSLQDDLWGINIYPDKSGEEMIEFDSMINLRPRLGNRSRGVEDAALRQKIVEVVKSLIK